MLKCIYSIGTSNRSLDNFLRLLKAYEIKVAADVRRFPFSRRFPHFCRDMLSQALESIDIKYIYLGDQLGGLRKGGYDKYTHSQEFERGIEKLEQIAFTSNTVFFCCEKLFFKCHRRFIGRTLKKKGWSVYHILDFNSLYEEKEAG